MMNRGSDLDRFFLTIKKYVMNEKLKSIEESSFSINDEVVKALTGKVTEMGSALNENTVRLSRLNEMASQIPYFDKRLDTMADSVRELNQAAQSSSSGLKEVINAVQEKLGVLASRVSMPAEAIGVLRNELVNHAGLFEKPLRKEVHYRHFLGWPIVTLVAAGIAVAFMFVLWQENRIQLASAEIDDIKYRYMKLSADSVVQVRVQAAEEASRADADQFKKTVETDEELIWANTANYMRKMQLDSERRELKALKAQR
jgi:hypothetical protein